MSYLYTGIVGFFYFILAYYLIFKYINPELWDTEKILKINHLILCLLAGLGATFWFAYQDINIQKIVIRLNEAFSGLPLFIFPLVTQKWYYRLLTQIGMSLVFGFLFFVLSRPVNWFFCSKKGISLKKINSHFYYLVVFIYLLGVLATGFQTESLISRSTWFFGGTEEMITDRLETPTSFYGDLVYHGGFNFYYIDKAVDEKFIYLSSTGFYGAILKLIQNILHMDGKQVIPIFRFSYAFLFALALTFMVYKTRQLFGVLAGVFFAVMVSLIYWIVGPAKLFIWVCFVIYLPFIIPWFIYPKVIEGKWSFRKFCLWVFFLEFAVILRGYTYLGNFILAPTIAVIFYDLLNKKPVLQIFKRLIFIGLCGAAAFVLVIGIHTIQIKLFEGTFSGAIEYILGRVEFRLAGDYIPGSFKTGSYMEVFDIWMTKVGIFVPAISDYMKVDLFGTLVNLNNFYAFHAYFLLQILILGVLALSRYKVKNSFMLRKIFSLSLACLFAMFASWTWFAAKNHMIWHRHMNGIMYF